MRNSEVGLRKEKIGSEAQKAPGLWPNFFVIALLWRSLLGKMKPEETLDKSREDILKQISAAEKQQKSAEVNSRLSITPLIGRLESRLSGVGPGVTVSVPLPGDSVVRESIRLKNELSKDQVKLRLASLSLDDWRQGGAEEIQERANTEVIQTLESIGIKDTPINDRLKVEQHQSQALMKIYLSGDENPPLPDKVLAGLSNVEESLLNSLQSVSGKIRPWYKKIIPTRLTINAEPLALGRTLSPLAAAGLEFYRGTKIKLEDQARSLNRSVLELKSAKENGVKELFLALANLRDFPIYRQQITETLSQAKNDNQPTWEITEELRALAYRKHESDVTVKSWLGGIPDVSEKNDKELLALANQIASKTLKNYLPKVGELTELLKEKVSKLRGSKEKDHCREEFKKAILELSALEAPIQLSLGNDSLKRAQTIVVSGVPPKTLDIVAQSAKANGRSQSPMAPTMEEQSLSGMVIGELMVPELGKRELRKEYYKIQKKIGDLSVKVITENDEVTANLLHDRMTASLKAEESLVEGSLYSNRAKRISVESERALALLPTPRSKLSSVGITEPELYLALYKKAEIEAALLKKGDKETVLSGMAQATAKDSHTFISLNLSNLVEKPILGLFRKIFKKGPRPEELLGESNKEIIALRAAERFLEIEMERERLWAAASKKEDLAELGNPEDFRSWKSMENQAQRLDREYLTWKEFIQAAPTGLKEPLEKALYRESGRKNPISSEINRLQDQTLRKLYELNVGQTDLMSGVFSGWSKMGEMNRVGATFGFSFQSTETKWRDAELLSGIEDLQGRILKEEFSFLLEKNKASIKANNLLGAAQAFLDLKEDGLSLEMQTYLERQALRIKEEAEDTVRKVGLYIDESELPSIGLPIKSGTIKLDSRQEIEKLFPYQGIPQRGGRTQLSNFNLGVFAGDRFRGGSGTLGAIEVLGTSERAARNDLMKARELLQESERQIAIGRLQKRLSAIEEGIEKQTQSLHRFERRFWLEKHAWNEKHDPEVLSSLIDIIQNYFAVRGKAESDAEEIRHYQAYR
jgi:hypothetical protein